MDTAEREAETRRVLSEEASRPFDLARGPLVRACLVRLGAEEHVALVTMHHIISDGWSTGIFISEIAALYKAFLAEEESPLVLNVDDQDVPRYIKTRDLEESGFTVIEATSGAEALRIIEEKKPPVVLLDVQLPDIMGFDVCTFIKEKWTQTMVLMTSSTFITSASRTVAHVRPTAPRRSCSAAMRGALCVFTCGRSRSACTAQ